MARFSLQRERAASGEHENDHDSDNDNDHEDENEDDNESEDAADDEARPPRHGHSHQQVSSLAAEMRPSDRLELMGRGRGRAGPRLRPRSAGRN